MTFVIAFSVDDFISDGKKRVPAATPQPSFAKPLDVFRFCAHEYEKSKDMAAAALAYKCMEVAYMRAIYSSHTTANRDRNELQMALQVIPPGN